MKFLRPAGRVGAQVRLRKADQGGGASTETIRRVLGKIGGVDSDIRQKGFRGSWRPEVSNATGGLVSELLRLRRRLTECEAPSA